MAPPRALQNTVVEHITLTATPAATGKVSFLAAEAGAIVAASVRNGGGAAFTTAAHVDIGATRVATGSATLGIDAIEAPAILAGAVLAGDRIDLNAGDQLSDIAITIQKSINTG